MLMRQDSANNPPVAVSQQSVPSETDKMVGQSPPVRPRSPPKVGKKDRAKETRFDVHKQAVELSLDKFGDRQMITILAGGIINPFGPTLNAFALDGDIEPGCTLPILHLMFNPFAQKVTEVGKATFGDTWNPLEVIPQLFGIPFGCCPTLLFPSKLYSHEEAVMLYAQFLGTFNDGHAVLEKVRRFPGDPWHRVKSDASELTSMFEKMQQGQSDEASQRQLTRDEALELSGNFLPGRGGDRSTNQQRLNASDISKEFVRTLFVTDENPLEPR